MATILENKQKADNAFLGILNNQPASSAQGDSLSVTDSSPIKKVEMPTTLSVGDFDVPEPIIPEMTTPDDAKVAGMKETDAIADTSQEATTQSIDEMLKSLETPTEAETERESLTSRFEQRLKDITPKGTRLAEEEAKLGIQADVKRLREINTQIAQLQGGLQQGLALEEGRVAPRQFITGVQAQMRSQAAAEIGALSTLSQALQGNISLAQATAQKTVDLEFAPAEQEIANLQTLINLNYQDLTRADKKRADELSLKLTQRQEEIDADKDNKSLLFDVAINAAKNGADQKTLNAILKSETPQNALMVGAGFMVEQETPEEKEKRELELQILRNEASGITSLPTGVERAEKVLDLRGKVRGEPAFKTLIEIRNGYQNVSVGAGLDNAQGDLAIVNGFAKMLDPTGVVRPAEFDTVEEAQGFFERMANTKEKIFTGARLKSSVRSKFEEAANALFNEKQNTMESEIKNIYEPISNGFGIGVDEIFDFSAQQEVSNVGTFRLQNTEYFDTTIAPIVETENLNEEETLQLINRLQNKVSVNEDGSGFLANFGQVTSEGSPLWKHGLDVDLAKGDKVPTPFGGKVVFAGINGGFGNQVRIETEDGREIWLSHLDNINVKPGKTIASGEIIGVGGNSGSVIPGKGGDGSHLDITILNKDKSFVSPTKIKNLLS